MTSKQKLVIMGGVVIVGAWLIKRSSAGGANVTAWEVFDLESIGGMTSYPRRLVEFAQAIARAEGFYVQGSVPQRANNPGAIKVPGHDGPTLGQNISVLPTADAGWAALYKQLMLIVSGRSAYYSLDQTIAEMAAKWTGTATEAQNWATNVAATLGVSRDARLWEVMV